VPAQDEKQGQDQKLLCVDEVVKTADAHAIEKHLSTLQGPDAPKFFILFAAVSVSLTL